MARLVESEAASKQNQDQAIHILLPDVHLVQCLTP